MATQASNASVRSDVSGPAEPLYQVKLLAALRSGDPAQIHPFLADIGKDQSRRASTSTLGDSSLAPAALHLAIRCGTYDTVNLVLSHKAISPNAVHPPGSRTTALHLAASLGRADVVRLLLEQEEIDDTLRDEKGKTAVDVARGRDVVRAIHDSRAFLTASYRSLLRTYAMSPLPPAAPSAHDPGPPSPPNALLSILSSPRTKLLDLSHLDDTTGLSLLHAAAARKDLRLIELAIRAGADVFVRDRRGRGVVEAAGKDERVRAFLRQFTNRDTALLETQDSAAEPPTLKGYLNKYTNVAKGYSTRWFVLRGGVLSYYRHQEDEAVASRGSIAMKTAVLRSDDKMRFEVHSSPPRAGASVQKWFIKANHPVEAARWTQAIARSIEWYRSRDRDLQGQGQSDPTRPPSRRSMDSEQSETSGKGRSSTNLISRARTMSTFPSRNASMTILAPATAVSSKKRNRITSSISSSLGVDTDLEPTSVNESDAEPDLHHVTAEPEPISGREDDSDQDAEANFSDGGEKAAKAVPPHTPQFDLHGNAAVAQLEATAQLLAGMPIPPGAPTNAAELQKALRDSMGTVQEMLSNYIQMARDRDDWWRRAVEAERRRQQAWEESLRMVVKEGEELERELKTRSRRRSSRIHDSVIIDRPVSTLKARRMPEGLPISETGEGVSSEAQLVETADLPTPKAQDGLPASSSGLSLGPLPSAGLAMARQFSPAMPGSPAYEDEGDTDEEDEFFDAIESNTLPNLVVNKSLISAAKPTPEMAIINKDQYKAYEHLRSRLMLDADNRPSTSLWSVLKGSIGKDLTKISFPVYFNEPTSMLQRMAEDMEFSECLDAAVNERDPHRRIAFVAAFAMSNYSSTIGRIAKPFNPMLGETFEYVRLDKEYRYVSEQVSHHPPITTCWAESPRWHYYGEVDAQNKFMGKSFEIRPTGVAHAELLLPEEWGPGYPKSTSPFAKGRVAEHYTWKKVTTNVSGFILANPTIDHYGEMVITNQRTKDRCVLTFKPRGWRGKDAFEISGHVMDAAGRVTYEIAGRWNSQLVARQVGNGRGSLNPDVSVGGPASPSHSTEYILLWRNSEKPKAPFNLTPFAITLNDCPRDTLLPYLCPTDCRLRPDQRAFEEGRYTRANDLKSMQEEKQRKTRKLREEGQLPPHNPRWFSAQTDADTGERVWAPARAGEQLAYWCEREKVWAAGGNVPWPDVESIFVVDEEAE
ncbi:hypothetical protein PUNSTDRAFT_147045 [Punctularia strigosozonata HHB-11173 SS5]|uniref:PH domain-containing protein n=1 Tax=Punctularia strigosozonata (strain HHB-11173) TaxID=741275 RepID=R7S0Z0_PUNST|nr:uncharacterized protein PUNSTDRAFT_147045 [Punctularia strigosozonata HHB-11173 SS5]EIN03462.1 hypothetical protein PUNSTDRAFT_147045 [Punctularia strigosozonata HHB-11173 SS5]